jgi:hypothetical protein
VRGKRVILNCVLVLTVLGIGCSSSTSTKELTESSGLPLVASYIAENQLQLHLAPVAALFGETRTDYKTFAGTGIGLVLKSYLDHGWVTQEIDTRSFPEVLGVFEGDAHVDNWWYHAKYTVYPDHDSNSFSGINDWKIMYPNGVVKEAGTGHGSLVATLKSDGSFEARCPPAVGYCGTWIGKYSEQGPAGFLDMAGGGGFSPPYHLVGKSTGRQVQLNWYKYSWSAEAQKLLHQDPGYGISADAGHFKVKELSGLQLVIDTVATAQFTWEVQLNDIAEATLGIKSVPGTGTVTFGKKPDGTWFVTKVTGL